ncbi:MAG: response regulator receiver-like protein [Marinobacter sp.]
MNESLVCVADDIGVRVWLERSLDSDWTIESVTSSDLSRVSRLVKAMGAPVVVVAVEEDSPERAIKTFTAIRKVCDSAELIAIAKRISQDALLQIMRAGARDCLITGVDTEAAPERIRRVIEASQHKPASAEGRGSRRNITLVTAVSAVVDTRFFCQNFVSEINRVLPDRHILAIDSLSKGERTFYFDNLNRLTLDELVTRQDSIDRSFVETALGEYSTGLRLLSGGLDREELAGDAGADLFITLTQLGELFDEVVVRVDHDLAELWLSAVGANVSRLYVVMHPVVDQVQEAEGFLQKANDWLSSECSKSLIVDGYERRAKLSVDDIEKTAGMACDLVLPMEWRHRLDSINAGVPLGMLPSHSAYHKKLHRYVSSTFVSKSSSKHRFGLKGRK